MTNYLKKLLALAIAAGAMTVLAEAPVAVWCNGFDQANEGYTFNRNGNTVANNAITIAAPLTVDFANEHNGITVLVKYGSFTSASANTALMTVYASEDHPDAVGFFAGPEKMGGIWEENAWGTAQINTALPAGDGPHTAICRYQSSDGTNQGSYLFFNGATTATWGSAGLKSTNYKVNGFTIGGTRGGTFATAAGMTIYGIAVFEGALNPADLADYEFPEPPPEPDSSTPVFLANMYNASASAVAGWTNNTQNDASSQIPKTAEWGSDSITSDAGVSFRATGGGNFFNTYTPVSTDFSSNGTYIDIFGVAHPTIAEEVATSLALPEGTVFDATVYKTGIANGGVSDHTATLSGLDTSKLYVVYVGLGLNKESQTQGFKIEESGYGSADAIEYVVSETGGNTTAASQYQTFNPGTVINPSANGVMIVRLSDITSKSDGTIVFNLASDRASLNFVAVAEVTRNTPTTLQATLAAAQTWAELTWESGGKTYDWINGDTAEITVTDEATLTLDPSVDVKAIKFTGSSPLTLTTADGEKPSDDFLAKLKLSDYTGRITYGWNSFPTVIAINFNAAGNYRLGDDENANILGMNIFGSTWAQFTAATQATAQTVDAIDTATEGQVGSANVTWRSNNTYQYADVTDKVIRGYLDDGGDHASVTITGIPFTAYDLIVVCATDEEGRQFNPVTVNEKNYRWNADNGTTESTTATGTAGTWGQSRGAYVEYGRNAIKINSLTASTLSIVGGAHANGARGGIAAVILVQSKMTFPEITDDLTMSELNALIGSRDEAIVRVLADATITQDGTSLACRQITLRAEETKTLSFALTADQLTAVAALSGEATYDVVNSIFGFTPTFEKVKVALTNVPADRKFLTLGGQPTIVVPAAEAIFTPANDDDWAGATLPFYAKKVAATENMSFAGRTDYLQNYEGRESTVAVVTAAPANTLLYGLSAFGGGAGLGAITRDIYLKVTGGTPAVISGGEDANWSSPKTIPTGNVLVNISGDTVVDYVYGAGLGGGSGGMLATINGSVGIVVDGNAQVKGTIAAGWQSRHAAIPKVTGNTSVLIKNVQTHENAATYTAGSLDCVQGWILGGGIFKVNGGRCLIEGNSSVTIDLENTATGAFAKKIAGGGHNEGGGDGENTSGNSSVTINAPNTVTFAQAIIGGGHSTGNNQAKTGGNSSVTLNGGTYTGTITAAGDNGDQTLVTGTATINAMAGDFSAATFVAGSASGAKTLNISGGTIVFKRDLATGFDVINFSGNFAYSFPDGTGALTPIALGSTALSVDEQTTGQVTRTGDLQVGEMVVKNATVIFDCDACTVSYTVSQEDTLRRRADFEGMTDADRLWTARGSWLDADNNPVDWPMQGAKIVQIDANEVSSIIVDARISAEMINLTNTATQEEEPSFKFLTLESLNEVALPKEDPAYVILGKLTATGFGGELYLQSRIRETIALGVNTHVCFVAGEAEEETTAYPYQFSGLENPICKVGPGAFVVPSSMYTYDFNVKGGSLIYDIAEGSEEIVSGNLKKETPADPETHLLIKRGAGTMAYTRKDLVNFLDGVEVRAGTFKLANPSGDYSFWDTTTPAGVTVQNGATLEMNGKGGFAANVTLEGGATLANSAGEIATHIASLRSITLLGDATIKATERFGLLANGYGATTLNLGGHTLTKIGAGAFHLCATSGADTGTIDVQAGSLHVVQNAASLPNVDVSLGAAATFDIGADTTIGGLTLGPTYTFSGSSTLTIAKTLTYAGPEDSVFTWYAAHLGEGATFVFPSTPFTMKFPTIPTTSITLPSVAKVELSVPNLSVGYVYPIAGVAKENVSVKVNGAVSTAAKVEVDATSIKILPPLSRQNPVTGETVGFSNVFRGTEDANWATSGNWYTGTDGAWVQWSGTAPMLPNTADGGYNPALIAGDMISEASRKEITLATMEGWNPCLGLYNGVTVTVATLNKIQRNAPSYFMVDATSKLTIAAPSNSKADSMDLYVAAENGITWSRVFSAGNALNYYLTGAGSVNYTAGVTGGTHTIKRFDLTIGDPNGEGLQRGIVSRKLVSFGAASSRTFTIAADAVVGIFDSDRHPLVVAAKSPVDALSGHEALGTYYTVQAADGVYVKYIGYTTNPEQPTQTIIDQDTTLSAFFTAHPSVTGEILVVGKATSENAFTVTVDCAIPEGVTFSVSGHANFAVGGSVTAIPVAPLTLESGASLGIAAPFDAAYTIAANRTVRIVENLTLTAPISMPASTLTAVLEVAPGKTLTLASGANLGGGYGLMRIYGTLDLGGTIQEFRTLSTEGVFHLYAGAEIKNGTLRQMGGHTPTLYFKNVEGATSTLVTLNCAWSDNGYGADNTFSVEPGVGIKYLNSTGAGRKTITGSAIGNLEVNGGVTITANSILNGEIKTGTGGSITLAGDNAFGEQANLFLPATINAGSTTQTFNATMTVESGSGTVPAFITDSSIIKKMGAGELVIGDKRPVMNVVEGSVKITASFAEITAGELVLRVTPDAAPVAGTQVTIVDGTGSEIGIRGEPVVDSVAHTVTITLATASISESQTMSEITSRFPDGGVIAINGSSACDDSVTITLDTAIPENDSFTVSGHVTFAVSGSVGQIPLSKITLNENACLVLNAPIAETAVTIEANRTIQTRADQTITLTNNGTFVVKTGATATVTASAAQAIKGVVTIEKGATFVNQSGDAISYGTPGTTVNVYGTLAMGATRWTVGGQSQINLYGSAHVTGAGSGDNESVGVFDIFRSGNTISVFNVTGEDPAAATIDGAIRVRRIDGNIWIQAGATLALPGGLKTADVANAKVTRQGEGQLTGLIPLVDPNNRRLTLDYGTQQKNLTAHFEVKSGTVKLHVTGTTNTENAICVDDTEEEPFIKILDNATLELDANNLSGSLGSVLSTGRIVNHGTLVFMDGNGARFFRQPLILEGGTVKVNGGDRPVILYGGAESAATAQIRVRRDSTATIIAGEGTNNKVLRLGNDTETAYGTPGAGVFVDEGGQLTVSCPIEGPDTLVKWGTGTLNIGSSREAKIAVEEGRLELVATIAELKAGRLSILASSDAEEVDLSKYRIINAGGEEMTEVAASREDGRYVFTWAVKMARVLTDFVDITVSETTVDYPVLVRLSEAALPGFKYDRAGSDGSKIRFYQLIDAADYDVADSERDVSRDAELPFEIVEWNPEGESLVWVKINPAKVNAKGKFRLYWHAIGELKAAPTTPDLSKLKYALDFNGADPATTMGSADSSNVTISGVPTIEAGAFKANAGSIILSESGENGLATCAKGFTMAFWVNPNGMANWGDACGFQIGDMIYKFEKNDRNQFSMYTISESSPHYANDANATPVIDFAANQWMHLALTTNEDGTGLKIYKNGTLLRNYLPGTDKNLWGTAQGARPILKKFVVGVKDLASYSGTTWYGADGRTSSALVDEVKIYNTALTAAEIAPLAAHQPTQALTTTFGLVNRPVNDDPRDRMWVDYWTQEPALKHYWKANELTAEIVNTAAAASALRSGRTIGSTVTTITGAAATLPLADLGLYLVTYAAASEAGGPHGAAYSYFDGPRRFEVEVVESRADPEIDPMGATESGRVLLANDDTRAVAPVTDQEYDSALWTHDDLASTFTEAHLQTGRMHTLTSSEGRTLWRLNSVYLGNMLKATDDDSLEIDPRFNTLPWSTTASSKTSMILRNLEGASIESNIFTNGIGTIYFDAVNVATNAPGSRLALVVEVTDAALDAEPDETTWRRLEVTPIKITGATISGQGATLVKEAPTNRIECLNVSCSNVSTFDYYRFYAPVNDKTPLRFRIYRDGWRPSEAPDREEDPDGWIAIDNIVASYAPVVPELEPAGKYDPTRFGGAALGVETAFAGASYPTPNDSIRGHVYLTYGNAEDLGSVRLRYRWRYLNARFEPALTREGAPVWKTAFFDLADKASGEYFTDALELPPHAGDLEYYYDITATVPFYDYVDYATATGVAAEPVMGYSEEPGRDKPIEIRAEKSLKPSGGTDWFVRLREWSSETRGYRLYVKDAAKADAPVKTVEMDFVGEGTWRGLIKSNESAGFGVGTIAYRLERDVPTTPGARAEDFMITTTYHRGNLDAESTPISLALIEGSAESWSTITNNDTTGYLMFQLDERTESLTILRADYQNFNAWHDAHSEDAKFVGNSTDNGVKSGVSSKMRAYQESFKTWTDSMRTDVLWCEDFANLPTSAVLEQAFAEARTRGERGWIAENGMWVASKYKDADATGKALQLEGQGLGRLTASGYDIEPRGLESVSYKARLADAIDFNSVAWDYASLSPSGDSYTFATQVAMSDTFPGEAMTFDGAGMVSIFANYLPGRSAYEFRVMRTRQGRLQMQLYKWTSPTTAPQLLHEDGANVGENYFRKEGNVGSPLYRTIYFSVSREADKSMRLQVGICKFGAAAGVNPETEFMGLTYWDKSNPLPMGAYGVAAANCAAKFDQPRSWNQPVVWQGAEDQRKVLNAPVVWPTESPDYAQSSLEDGRWAMDGERIAAFTDTTVAPARWGIAVKPVEQKLFFEYLAPTVKGQPEPEWVALSTNVVSSYLTTAYEAFLYRPVHGSYRISHGGERSAPRVDIVLDDIVLNQWGGAEFGDFDTLEYVRGNANQGYPTNFVFTSGWVTDHKLELSAKRTLPGAPCSLRTPLMDGLEGRGLGLGVFTLGYRNADKNLILHFQIATNNVAGSVKTETSSLDTNVWTTVRSVDFSKMSADEREEGVLSLYLGCHGVAGVARVLVEPSLAEAAAAADDPKFGSIEIVSAFCRDEPVLDDKSWWGWNIRTFGLDNLTRWDTGSRSYLSDFATSESPEALGLSLALNNSATEDTRVETEAALYKLNAPFVQTPSFKVEGGSIGAITFRARMFALGDDDQKAEVRLYGTTSTEPDAPAEAWELLDGGHFVISNSVYTTYAYRAKGEDTKYNAFRLAVTGVTEVNPGSRGPSPEEGEMPVRVMLDEIVVSEAIFPKMGFKYVYPVRTNLESNEVSPVYLELEGRANFREQPLLGENWTIQAEIMTKRLPDEIDLTREPEVTFSWYEGRIPWGYGNWKNLAGAKTAKLARAEGEKMIYRGSFKVASDAVVDASEASQFAVVQYTARITYYNKAGEPLTAELESGEWVKPYWFDPIDYNKTTFSAFTILEAISPRCAWINEVNVYDGKINGLYHLAATNQYVEVAFPAAQELKGWRLDYISNAVVTNTLAVFGSEGVPTEKLEPTEKDYAFMVLQSPKTRDAKTWENVTHDGVPVKIDGTWQNFDLNGGALDSEVPCALRLVRPSGIIEEAIVFEGTNKWVTGRYKDKYTIEKFVADRNAEGLAELNHFFGVGSEIKNPLVTGLKGLSLGVVAGAGQTADEWSSEKHQTPGWVNEDQEIPDDWAIQPAGSKIVITASVADAHIKQTFGDRVATTEAVKVTIPKGGEGTNITYQVDAWYEVDSLKTNKLELAALKGQTGTFTITVGKGCSNSIAVVASTVAREDLRETYGLDDTNDYTPAVMDWLDKGVNYFGDAFANPGEIKLAEYHDLNGVKLGDLSLTDMYWLDIDPTAGDWVLKGGVKNVGTKGKNFLITIKLELSNATEGLVYAPYILRGLTPGLTSVNHAEVGGNWSSATFKVTGDLQNGNENRAKWVPLRMFYFKPDATKANRSASFDENNEAVIEIWDPKDPNAGSQTAGWEKYPDALIFYKWAIDERNLPITTETLKPDSTF